MRGNHFIDYFQTTKRQKHRSDYQPYSFLQLVKPEI